MRVKFIIKCECQFNHSCSSTIFATKYFGQKLFGHPCAFCKFNLSQPSMLHCLPKLIGIIALKVFNLITEAFACPFQFALEGHVPFDWEFHCFVCIHNINSV